MNPAGVGNVSILAEPPWDGAILLCKECEYRAMDGAQFIDQNGKPVTGTKAMGITRGCVPLTGADH
jgi:hypothetical protein